MATADLPRRIEAALAEALSGAGFPLVSGVEVSRGWGDISIVTVHVTLAKSDASPALRTVINDVVATVLEGGRHYVEIRWGST